jgi:hypothetical protein
MTRFDADFACGYCTARMLPLNFADVTICPGCRLPWVWDSRGEQLMLCAGVDDIRRLVVAERARCVKILEDLGHDVLAQRLEGES